MNEECSLSHFSCSATRLLHGNVSHNLHSFDDCHNLLVWKLYSKTSVSFHFPPALFTVFDIRMLGSNECCRLLNSLNRNFKGVYYSRPRPAHSSLNCGPFSCIATYNQQGGWINANMWWSCSWVICYVLEDARELKIGDERETAKLL